LPQPRLIQHRVVFDLIARDRGLDVLDHGLEQRGVEIGDADGAVRPSCLSFISVSKISGRFMFRDGQCTR